LSSSFKALRTLVSELKDELAAKDAIHHDELAAKDAMHHDELVHKDAEIADKDAMHHDELARKDAEIARLDRANSQRRASAVDAVKDVKKAFLSYDADGSGEIDKDELQHLLTDLGLAQSDLAHSPKWVKIASTTLTNLPRFTTTLPPFEGRGMRT
jgi:hypothetical protein